MELDILKHFIKNEVEVLVGGVWIEGLLMPIIKGVVVLMPLGEAAAFYGPTSLKADLIQAVRQVKSNKVTSMPTAPTMSDIVPPANVKSSFEGVPPHQRFAKK